MSDKPELKHHKGYRGQTFCYIDITDGVNLPDSIQDVDCPKCKREIDILIRTGGN